MKIAHISDIHCGEVHFVPGLMERAINEINDQQPDIVVCSGDLTAMGFKHEYVQAKAYLDRLECDTVVVIPGKHDSYAWRLEDLFVINAGTVSSQRLRGRTRPCYNLIEITDHHVDVWRKYPFHGQERIIQFSTETRSFEKYTARIEGEVTSSR